MIPEKLKEKGLICFEEITDYSIINDTQLRKKLKRKVTSQKTNNEVISSANKSKKVKFNEDVLTIDIPTLDKRNAKKSLKRKKLLKKKRINKSLIPKKLSKSQKSNSTSGISLPKSLIGKSIDDGDTNSSEFESKMEAWSDLMLPNPLLKALFDKEFYEPTQIQKLVLPEAIKNKSNIIGTAQTGSGKTLAFGLPILTHLLDSYNSKSLEFNKAKEEEQAPAALILTPTRELAIQIKDHLQICCKYSKIKIAVVVGGISQLKQERLLNKLPEIVVATPGRLMQLIEEGNTYLSNINRIKYFVIDEADRMIEKGHFGEMEKILALINRDDRFKLKRQSFLFSATLITKFQENYQILEKQKEKSEKQLKKEEKAKLNYLIEKIQMIKPPKLFDLTTKAVTADNLVESKIFCQLNEKDSYLYYFICKYSGRTLVFANSIDCVRRLTNLFRLLKKTPLHLHANLNQKQRLKNLEKFNAEEDSLLIASDVASRGLDIPGVMHVIHYQIPRSPEIYVHRSGRTARLSKEGLSVMLVSPEEINLYRKIIKTFKNEKEIKDYPIDRDFYEECKLRTSLARKIDELEHRLNKEKSESNWYQKHAKLLDIDLDDEILKETKVDGNKLSKEKRKLGQMKQELNERFNNIVYPKVMSRKYPETKNIDRIISMNSNS